jgi:hypothetical protein
VDLGHDASSWRLKCGHASHRRRALEDRWTELLGPATKVCTSTVLVFTFFRVGGIDWSDHSEAMASEDRGVERTNDDATESKCSAVSLGYYDDK